MFNIFIKHVPHKKNFMSDHFFAFVGILLTKLLGYYSNMARLISGLR